MPGMLSAKCDCVCVIEIKTVERDHRQLNKQQELSNYSVGKPIAQLQQNEKREQKTFLRKAIVGLIMPFGCNHQARYLTDCNQRDFPLIKIHNKRFRVQRFWTLERPPSAGCH